MARLTREEVADIALLARLHLEDDELTALETDLGALLASFAVIAGVDTSDVPPMTHAVPVDLALRHDIAMPSLDVDLALRGAPKRDGELLVVPAILPTERE